jgi:hypothetical protein
MVGWIRIKISGKKGDQVTLKFAEVLDKEGKNFLEHSQIIPLTFSILSDPKAFLRLRHLPPFEALRSKIPIPDPDPIF